MTGVSLVWVNTTVGTVCATTGFGSLLDDDVFNEEVLEGERFCVGVRFGVLQETGDELDGLLGPATFIGLKTTHDNRQTCQTPKKNHF